MPKKNDRQPDSLCTLSIIAYAGVFLLLTITFLLSPHNIDDTYYDYLNLKGIKEIFTFAASYGNGRILGNALSLILCKSAILAAIIRAAGIIVNALLLTELTDENKENKALYSSLSLLLMLALDRTMFGQVYGWISAFTNFLPPVTLMLSGILILKRYEKGNKKNAVFLPLLAVIGFCAGLFSENSTIYILALGFIVLVLNAVWKLKKALPASAFFGGSIAGAVTMLYARLHLSGHNGHFEVNNYQHIPQTPKAIIKAVIMHIPTAINHISHGFILLFFLSAAALIILKKRSFKREKLNRIKPLVASALVFYPVLWLFKSLDYSPTHFGRLDLADNAFLLLALAAYIAAIIFVIALIESREQKVRIILFSLFAVFTVLPLLIVSPISARVYYFTYVLMCIVTLLMTRYAISLGIAFSKKSAVRFAYIASAAIAVFVTFTYANIFSLNSEVEKYIDYQIAQGETVISICPLNESGYYYTDVNMYIYQHYNKEPGDVEFKEITIDDWYFNHYKTGNYKTE